jgi:hypothetical protein
MTPQEVAHWTRIKAAWISTYRAWGKARPKPEYIDSFAADMADRSVESLRERQRRSKGSRS